MVRELDPVAADDAVSEGAVLLDVREPDEFAAGHAPEAVSVPLGALEGTSGTLDSTRPIVCVCRSGARSTTATTALVAAGFNAANLAGGMQAWAAAGLPVVDAAGGAGTVI